MIQRDITRSILFVAIPLVSLSSCITEEPALQQEVRIQPAGNQTGDRAPLYGATLNGVDGEYIVVFHADVTAQDIDATIDQAEVAGTLQMQHDYSLITGFAATMDQPALDAVRLSPAVAYVEQNQLASTTTVYSSPAAGIDRIDQRQGRDGLYNNHGYRGNGTHVYILDTGIRATHNEFAGRVGAGRDIIDKDNTPQDCHGHGTHVASTAMGAQYGVAKGAVVHAVRVLDCQGRGSYAGIIAGIEFAVSDCAARGGACVMNMSLGGPHSRAVNDAVAKATEANVNVVVAAGNSSADACIPSPASAPPAITVAAVSGNDRRATFSNHGPCVDIFAPGVSILGAGHDSNSATRYLSGTSMSAPHVTGVVALYLEAYPDATPKDVVIALREAAGLNCVQDPNNAPNLFLHNDFAAAPYDCLNPPPPPWVDTCVDACGGMAPTGCYCDPGCVSFGDCCPDFQAVCQ